MRRLIASLIAAPILFGGVPGFAQSNPTAEQIIDALKPTGNLQNGNTRGFRLASPTDQTTAAAPAWPSAPASSASGPGVRTAATQPMAPVAVFPGRAVDQPDGSVRHRLRPTYAGSHDNAGRTRPRAEQS